LKLFDKDKVYTTHAKRKTLSPMF